MLATSWTRLPTVERLRPGADVGPVRRLRLTNGGYKELLEAIKKLKAGTTSKGDTVDLARRAFTEGGCDDLFSALRP